MAAAASDRYTAPPLTLPEGHCQRVEDGSPWYWVKGSEVWRLVNAETGCCDCPAFVFRCSFRVGDLCRHGKRLARYLAELAACPTCRGRAFLVPSPLMHYVDRDGKRDTAALACVTCGGTGKRSE